jgi:hypothetical protein
MDMSEGIRAALLDVRWRSSAAISLAAHTLMPKAAAETR